ncbi:MAG: SIMPL domain-containing protein [Flavitalea sp.]
MSERFSFNLSSLVFGISIIVSAIIFSNAYKYKFRATENITVTGLAEVNFASDLIVWEGNYSRKSFELKTAYADLKRDEQAIRNYLRVKGIPDSSIVISAVDLQKEFSNNYDKNGNMISSVFNGYNLKQGIKIESKEIDKVENLSRQVTELIETGIEFNSIPPSYYYTKLADLKMNLLAQASSDAMQRAQTIAESAKSGLDKLKKSSMGVFQITGRNSNEEFSYGGSYNTSERNKTASITIRMEYGVK